jgi:acyl-CoA hydrolase
MGDWRSKAVPAEEAVRQVHHGARVFIHGAAATPKALLEALAARRDIEDVRLYHLHTTGTACFVAPECRDRLRSVSLFVGPEVRKAVGEGRADFMPIFLSDIPSLFRTKRIPLDVALLQLSPPDRHGLCTLGTSVDAARGAVESAKVLVAEINERMPRTHGNTAVPLSAIDAYTIVDRPLPQTKQSDETPVEGRIGELIADMIDDGSCLQLGIGAIPDAVARRLGDKNDLGVHTEMFSDGIVDLQTSGVINNKFKKVHPGRTVTSFVTGSQKLYDFVADNPLVEFHGCDRTNDISLIRKNDKVMAINSALEIDLTGQICADSIGHTIYSGIGGQMDYMHAAAYSEGGKPIIALPSTAAGGKISRIVSTLKPGAGVVTTRGHVHWVVTEFGAVDLHGRTLRERGEMLISIAHPSFRDQLHAELVQLRHF